MRLGPHGDFPRNPPLTPWVTNHRHQKASSRCSMILPLSLSRKCRCRHISTLRARSGNSARSCFGFAGDMERRGRDLSAGLPASRPVRPRCNSTRSTSGRGACLRLWPRALPPSFEGLLGPAELEAPGNAFATAQLNNAVLALQAILHDPGTFSSAKYCLGCAPDVLNDHLSVAFARSGFLSHLHCLVVAMSHNPTFLKSP